MVKTHIAVKCGLCGRGPIYTACTKPSETAKTFGGKIVCTQCRKIEMGSLQNNRPS